jgi:hypothetical protein
MMDVELGNIINQVNLIWYIYAHKNRELTISNRALYIILRYFHNSVHSIIQSLTKLYAYNIHLNYQYFGITLEGIYR